MSCDVRINRSHQHHRLRRRKGVVFPKSHCSFVVSESNPISEFSRILSFFRLVVRNTKRVSIIIFKGFMVVGERAGVWDEKINKCIITITIL